MTEQLQYPFMYTPISVIGRLFCSFLAPPFLSRTKQANAFSIQSTAILRVEPSHISASHHNIRSKSIAFGINMDSIVKKPPARKLLTKSVSEGAIPRATVASSKKEETTTENASISHKATHQAQEAPDAVLPTSTTAQPQVPAPERARRTRSDENKTYSHKKVSKSTINDSLEGLAPATSAAGPDIMRPKDTTLVSGRTRSATQGAKSKSPSPEEGGHPSSLPSTRGWKPAELVALEALYKSTNGTPDAASRNQLAFNLNRYV